MLSLDVDGGKIKAVIGTAKPDITAVKDYFEVDAGDDSLQNDGAPERLGKLLRDAINERGLTVNKCVIPVYGADLFFRRVSLPKVNPRRLKEMIPHSLGAIPAIQDYYIDYIVEREHQNGDKKMLDLLVCGAPKKLAASYYSLAQAAGLTPYRMDARMNCIHKLLGEKTEINGEGLQGKSILLLDAGSVFFGADLIVDAKSVFERTVSIQRQSDPFDDNINMLSFGEAQGSENDRLYAKISGEAQKMTQFSLTRALKAPVTRVYLYGEHSADSGLAAYLTDALGIETEPLVSITGLRFEKGYKGPAFCNIFGLAAALAQ